MQITLSLSFMLASGLKLNLAVIFKIYFQQPLLNLTEKKKENDNNAFICVCA